MRPSKKKKTSVQITRPTAPQARNLNFRNNDNPLNPTYSATHVVISATSSEARQVGMLLSQRSEPNKSEYIGNQIDMQHDESEKPKQRKRTQAVVMEEWLTYRDAYLQELLRHDGRGGEEVTSCADCGNSGDFSCFDCPYCIHYCQDCLVKRHRLMPLHRIKV